MSVHFVKSHNQKRLLYKLQSLLLICLVLGFNHQKRKNVIRKSHKKNKNSNKKMIERKVFH